MVMPLWDDNPFTKPTKPWATWTLILLNIVAFVVEFAGGDAGSERIIQAYALTPVSLTSPTSIISMLPSDLTLVTYMYLHADIFHLLGNMIFLFVFGDDIEEAMGPLRFLVFYHLCGIAGALVFAASGPQSTLPLIGASGAVSGVIAAYLMLRPCAKIRVLAFWFVFKLDAFWVIGIWAALQLIQLATQSNDDVAYWCHIGGLAAGAVLFPIMRREGVDLFECMEHRGGSTSIPDTSGLPGAPREPTVR
jgi:membrane associated rhomboid family serine protease